MSVAKYLRKEESIMAAKKPSKRTKKLVASKRLEKKQTLTTSRLDPYKTFPS
jgi:hypothetical protein